MDKKAFIEELYKKRSEYMYPEQAEGMANLLNTVSGDIYSESQRFVFELIQNADDSAIDSNNEVNFVFFQDCLTVSHNGKAFSREDIESLTGAGSSTKKEDTTKTGYKGIGFKSVFGKSNRVSVFSDGFQFRFDKSHFQSVLPWQIIPIWTDLSDLPVATQEFVQKNNYAVSTIIERKDIDSLQNDLLGLLGDGQILLFLRRVSKVTVSKNGTQLYVVEKRTSSRDTMFNEVSLIRNGIVISSWITKTFDKIAVPADITNALKDDETTPKKLREVKFTELSFCARLESDRIRALKDGESLIFTYLPTKVTHFRLPFLVNGSFLTNAAREAIHEDKAWNQWLFALIAEKIFQWMVVLSKSKYKFQTLQLLPAKFNDLQNRLKQSFDQSFASHCQSCDFIITGKGSVSKPGNLLLDKTKLSVQPFIDPIAIVEFVKVEKKRDYPVDCFVHPLMEETHKLKSIGVETFDLEKFDSFFASTFFTKRHQVEDNFSLIKYFKERSDNDKEGVWFDTLKTLSFIFDEEKSLSNPSTGICFPVGVKSTELGKIPVIHSQIFDEIQKVQPVYDWLKKLGVKEPSQVTYVTNVIIPGIKKGNFITEINFLPITNYLFRLFRQQKLDDEIIEHLRELPLVTKAKSKSFRQAQHCFLSNKYRPELNLEGVIKELSFVSEEYLAGENAPLEWNLFFKAIKVKDRVEIETISQNNTLPVLRTLMHPDWVDQGYKIAKAIPGSFGHGDHNIIKNVKIPSFLQKISTSNEYSKLFWKYITGSESTLASLLEQAEFRYGEGNGKNAYRSAVENYFPWFVRHEMCIPTTAGQILKAEEVFINDKEIKKIVGDYLPIFDSDEPLREEWKTFLGFKGKLELNDYLSVLSKIVRHADEVEVKESKFKAPIQNIGLIYNKLACLLSEIAASDKNVITDWAVNNRLLSSNGHFEPSAELIWITVEGFSTESDTLKVIELPNNCDTKSPTFKELMALFQVKTIEEYIPVFNQKMPEPSLKKRFETILPYYAARVAQKKFLDVQEEFDRLYHVLSDTEFFTTSGIKLSFTYLTKSIDGPSLPVYKDGNDLYFKGKWRSERTLLSLLKELSLHLGVTGLNEELRFLLLEEDQNEIIEWLVEQGVDLTGVKPVRPFARTVIAEPVVIAPVYEVKENASFIENHADETAAITVKPSATRSDPKLNEDGDKGAITEVTNSMIGSASTIGESFTPLVSASSVDVSSVSVNIKTYTGALAKMASTYGNIESQEVKEQVGRWCEEIVNAWLIKQPHRFSNVVWQNEHGESGKPYDFTFSEDGKEKFMDVKGTPSGDKDIIYLSPAEWVFMFDKMDRYCIYRVYNAGEDARIDVIENPGGGLIRGDIFPDPITLHV
jgi:hypothetical protein